VSLEAKWLIGIHDYRDAQYRSDCAVEDVAPPGYSHRAERFEISFVNALAVVKMKVAGGYISYGDEAYSIVREGRSVVIAVGDGFANLGEAPAADVLSELPITRLTTCLRERLRPSDGLPV
jgi:hypothetical protein